MLIGMLKICYLPPRFFLRTALDSKQRLVLSLHSVFDTAIRLSLVARLFFVAHDFSAEP